MHEDKKEVAQEAHQRLTCPSVNACSVSDEGRKKKSKQHRMFCELFLPLSTISAVTGKQTGKLWPPICLLCFNMLTVTEILLTCSGGSSDWGNCFETWNFFSPSVYVSVDEKVKGFNCPLRILFSFLLALLGFWKKYLRVGKRLRWQTNTFSEWMKQRKFWRWMKFLVKLKKSLTEMCCIQAENKVKISFKIGRNLGDIL